MSSSKRPNPFAGAVEEALSNIFGPQPDSKEPQRSNESVPGGSSAQIIEAYMDRGRRISAMPQFRTPSLSLRELLPHQKEALGRVIQWIDDPECKGGVLADDMGLGKTLVAIALIMERRPTTDRPALIVVPASLMRNWRNEIMLTIPLQREEDLDRTLNRVLYIHTQYDFAKSMKSLTGTQISKYHVIVVTHGMLATERVSDRTEAKQKKYKSSANARKRIDNQDPTFLIDSLRPSLLIVDETHRAVNSATALHKAVHAINAPKKLFLTGSPFRNGSNDVKSYFKFLDLPLGEDGIFKKLLNTKDKGFSTLEQQRMLNTILQSLMVRRFKEDHLENFPVKHTFVEEHAYKPNVGFKYTATIWGKTKTFVFPLEETNPLAISMRPRQMAVHPALPLRNEEKQAFALEKDDWSALCTKFEKNWRSDADLNSSPRFLKVAEIIKEYNRKYGSGKGGRIPKTIVFSQWRRALDLLAIHLRQMEGMTEEDMLHQIDGTVSQDDRGTIIDGFIGEKNGKITNPGAVLLASTACASEGLNVPAANQVIFLSLTYCPANEDQAEFRAHRMGQKDEVLVYHLLAEGCAEEGCLLNRCFKKKGHAREIIDGKRDRHGSESMDEDEDEDEDEYEIIYTNKYRQDSDVAYLWPLLRNAEEAVRDDQLNTMVREQDMVQEEYSGEDF